MCRPGNKRLDFGDNPDDEDIVKLIGEVVGILLITQKFVQEIVSPNASLTRDEPGTHVGRELVLGVMLLSQWGGVPSLANFRGSLSLCLHPLIKNDQIRRGNTHWEEEEKISHRH